MFSSQFRELKQNYMCFIYLEKAFDRVPRKVLEWALRKRGIPEAIVRAVMSLYEGATTRVRIGLELCEECEVKVGVHQGSVLLPLVFAIVFDVVPESVRNGLMYEMLYADDLVSMSETMERREGEVLEIEGGVQEQGAEGEPREDESGSVSGAEGEVSVSKVDPCGICGKRVMAN